MIHNCQQNPIKSHHILSVKDVEKALEQKKLPLLYDAFPRKTLTSHLRDSVTVKSS